MASSHGKNCSGKGPAHRSSSGGLSTLCGKVNSTKPFPVHLTHFTSHLFCSISSGFLKNRGRRQHSVLNRLSETKEMPLPHIKALTAYFFLLYIIFLVSSSKESISILLIKSHCFKVSDATSNKKYPRDGKQPLH